MKSTCPKPAPRVGDPTPSIFHLLALGVGLGGKANFSVCVGGKATCWYPQREILASGVLPNTMAQRECFHIAVEYRLKLL